MVKFKIHSLKLLNLKYTQTNCSDNERLCCINIDFLPVSYEVWIDREINIGELTFSVEFRKRS